MIPISVLALVFVAGYYLLRSYKKEVSAAEEEPMDNGSPKAQAYKNLIILSVCSLLAGITAFFITAVPQQTAEYNMLAVAAVAAVSAVTDLIYRKISNYAVIFLLAFAGISLVIEFFTKPEGFSAHIASAVLGLAGYFVILFSVSRITRGGIGSGDIKLMSAVAFALGFVNATYIMIIALALCLVYSIGVLILRKKQLKDEVPFGPFIFGGYIIFALLVWWGSIR